MSKSIAIVQSNYIPWKGYFDLINLVDEFVLYDDVQYTRRDWRNRNRIKTPTGPHWLTIPVDTKGKYLQKVKDTMIADSSWRSVHWRSIVHNYSHAAGFACYRDELEALYRDATDSSLSLTNHRFLVTICNWLGIATPLSWSSAYSLEEDRTRRLVGICSQAGANVYLSGPSARAYLDETLFEDEGIEVRYMSYDGYPEYPQVHPPFRHDVSILDLLLNTGRHARTYLKSLSCTQA
jgi:WbqC-like protein family